MEKFKKICKQALPVAALLVMFAAGTVSGYFLHGSIAPSVDTMAAEHVEIQGNVQTAAPSETVEAAKEETETPPAPEAQPAAAEQTAPPKAQTKSLDDVTVWLADNPSIYHTRKTCHYLRQTREKGHENDMRHGDAKKLWRKCADCPAPSVN